MNPSSSAKKIMRFGLLGAVGCLVGWGVGEPLLRACLPAPQQEERPTLSLVSKPEAPPPLVKAPTQPVSPAPALPGAPPPPKAPPPPPPEMAERLKEAGARTGDIQISLQWFNYNDLDLHCIDPSGEEVYFSNKKVRSGGWLDVDMNVSAGGSKRPVENIHWPDGTAPLGTYKVYVHHYKNHGDPDPTAYAVSVLVRNDRKEFKGSISKGDPKKLVHEFELKPPAPQLRLAAPSSVVVNQGGTNRLKVKIARDNFTGPVKFKFDGELRGVSFGELTIPPEETEGELEVRADTLARGGLRDIVLVATSDRLIAEAKLKVEVNPVPPVLRLAVPSGLVVNQGGSNQLPLRVARDYFTGPVTLTFAGDLDGLTLKPVTLSPDQSEAEVEVTATSSARDGARTIQVLGAGGATGTVRSAVPLQVTINPVAPPTAPRWSWRTVGVTGGWTALLAVGLSLGLVMGQNRYLGRALLTARQLAMLLLGGTAAGLVAGGIGQIFLGLMSQADAFPAIAFLTRLPFVPQIGFTLAWCLLGTLLGRGVGLFIPNLNARRAGIAGTIGGLLGAIAFLTVSAFGDDLFPGYGSLAGRLSGAALLGLCIGLMVALVEACFREAWVEVDYGPGESRTVGLGSEPVTIGSDPACTVYVRQAPAIALRYVLDNGQIKCAQGDGELHLIAPGSAQMIGAVRVVANGLVPDRAPAAGTRVFSLRVATRDDVPLPLGGRLATTDLNGLESSAGNGIVAEVVPNPSNPAILGLKNLSRAAWSVTQPDGSSRRVDPGRSIQLASGVTIDFGPLRGEVR